MYGKEIKMELITNGNEISVTNDNRVHFVDLYVESLLTKSVKKQFDAFRNGFLQDRNLNCFFVKSYFSSLNFN